MFNAVNLRNLFLCVFSEVYTVYFVLIYFQSHCHVRSYCVGVVLAVRTSVNWISSCRFHLHIIWTLFQSINKMYIYHCNKHPKFSVITVSEQLHDQTYLCFKLL